MEFLLMMSHFLLAIKIYETLFHDPDLQNCHQFPMFQEEITDWKGNGQPNMPIVWWIPKIDATAYIQLSKNIWRVKKSCTIKGWFSTLRNSSINHLQSQLALRISLFPGETSRPNNSARRCRSAFWSVWSSWSAEPSRNRRKLVETAGTTWVPWGYPKMDGS